MSDLMREDWLHDVGQHLLETLFADADIPAPPAWRVSVGWPHGSRGKVIGQCFKREAADDNANHLFVSPTIDKSEDVVAVLAHELIHACDDCESGHRGAFAKWATALGFERPFAECVPGDTLKEVIAETVTIFGEYPHKKLDTTQRKKQTTRNLKWGCKKCGFKANAARTQLRAVQEGECSCPVCAYRGLYVSINGTEQRLTSVDFDNIDLV